MRISDKIKAVQRVILGSLIAALTLIIILMASFYDIETTTYKIEVNNENNN